MACGCVLVVLNWTLRVSGSSADDGVLRES